MKTGQLILISRDGQYGFIAPDIHNAQRENSASKNILIHKERISKEMSAEEFRKLKGTRFYYTDVHNAANGKLMAIHAIPCVGRERFPFGLNAWFQKNKIRIISYEHDILPVEIREKYMLVVALTSSRSAHLHDFYAYLRSNIGDVTPYEPYRPHEMYAQTVLKQCADLKEFGVFGDFSYNEHTGTLDIKKGKNYDEYARRIGFYLNGNMKMTAILFEAFKGTGLEYIRNIIAEIQGKRYYFGAALFDRFTETPVFITWVIDNRIKIAQSSKSMAMIQENRRNKFLLCETSNQFLAMSRDNTDALLVAPDTLFNTLCGRYLLPEIDSTRNAGAAAFLGNIFKNGNSAHPFPPAIITDVIIKAAIQTIGHATRPINFSNLRDSIRLVAAKSLEERFRTILGVHYFSKNQGKRFEAEVIDSSVKSSLTNENIELVISAMLQSGCILQIGHHNGNALKITTENIDEINDKLKAYAQEKLHECEYGKNTDFSTELLMDIKQLTGWEMESTPSQTMAFC